MPDVTQPDVTQPTDITTLLRRWQAGDSHAYDLVMSWAYQGMLAIAAGFASGENADRAGGFSERSLYQVAQDPKHAVERPASFFLRSGRGAAPHFGGSGTGARSAEREGSQRRIPMSDDLSWVDVGGQDMLDLDRALTDLEKLDADKVRLVELRYLMGCTVPEICELRGVSDATVERHLRFARTWLYDRLHSGMT